MYSRFHREWSHGSHTLHAITVRYSGMSLAWWRNKRRRAENYLCGDVQSLVPDGPVLLFADMIALLSSSIIVGAAS
ncbi:hypothetical protein RRG08_036483 [Elysia crispata]|uniref:Uncharacterized protein n=1 Tax=Elysia crispata TaxID=231223 RepID=A0AAE0ZK26_9GAST|nr:hypothetical protein RRG08_036483 [Elysia crispata]